MTTTNPTRVLRCAVPDCLVGIRVAVDNADELAGRWTCPDHRAADVACRFCERTRSTCRRIPGGCCGACDHHTEGIRQGSADVRERHPAGEVAPATGSEGRERGPFLPAETDLRTSALPIPATTERN